MPTPFSLTTPLPEEDLRFDSMQHSAGVSALEETQLFLLSDKSDIAPEDLLGQPASRFQVRLLVKRPDTQPSAPPPPEA